MKFGVHSYGFDDVTQRDVRYLERSKRVANSAKGLQGATSFIAASSTLSG